MATGRRGSRRGQRQAPARPAVEDETQLLGPGLTGSYLVLLAEGGEEMRAGAAALRSVAGLQVAHSRDFKKKPLMSAFDEADTVVFDELGVAVCDTPPDQIQALSGVESASGILAVEPERVVYALNDEPRVPTIPPVTPAPALGVSEAWTVEYLRGYRDAVNQLIARLLGEPADGVPEPITEPLAALNEAELTWGLQVTRAGSSRRTGRGIRVAVLDTGLDLQHPDFATRVIEAQSFVAGQAVQDGHGHGTHCIGTSCGPAAPQRLPRYGVATGAEIFAGKVLSNQGSGADRGILAGIQWAMVNRCAVVSMSLGAPTQIGAPPSRIFDQVGQRALRAGTLIVAAAGNDSNRPSVVSPVSHPANCPSIMAVAAVDQQLRVARFSNAGLNPRGGQVDIAGPGVAVHSSWPRPVLYNRISGTSMATAPRGRHRGAARGGQPHRAGRRALDASPADGAATAAARAGHRRWPGAGALSRTARLETRRPLVSRGVLIHDRGSRCYWSRAGVLYW
jgi:subtilisin